MKCVWVLSMLVTTPVWAKGYEQRREADQVAMEKALLARCPKQAEKIRQTGTSQPPAERCEALVSLAACGRDVEAYHLKTSAACFGKDDFAQAEKSARAALAIRVTESAQVSLLMALARTKSRSEAQEKDLAEHLGYFAKRPCQRDDLCVGLAYVGWHLDLEGITVQSAQRAIDKGFEGWQPYFFGGSVLLGGDESDRAKGRAWLLEAKARGGPKAIDRMLGLEP